MSLRLPDGLTLYFARHGETEANVARRFQGWTRDTPLTPLGLQQAAAIATILQRELGPAPAIRMVASPLSRARLTMEIIRDRLGLPLEGFATDNRLKEINLGAWDGLTDAEAQAQSPVLFSTRGNDKWHVRVPGGENYAEVAARVTDWVRELDADTFAVSHGATTRILRGLLGGLDWRAMSALDEPQGVVFRARGSEVVKLEPGSELG
jgi:probable phosphoglycerate mutase